MSCSFCGASFHDLFGRTSTTYTTCSDCNEGTKSLITLTNKLQAHKSTNAAISSPNSYPGFVNVVKWLVEMKETEEKLNEKIAFLSSFVTALRDQIHPDIQVKPGNNGIPIPAHRALLAAKSDIFRNLLDSDACKTAPLDTITLPELNYDELQSLLEFLYSGSLSTDKIDRHVRSLSVAAHKYNIPFLQKFCEHQMLGSLNTSNALDVLELSDMCSNQALKETVLNFIVRNAEDVVFSSQFDAFALKNPHLTLQVTRASFMGIKNRKNVA